MGSGRAGGRGGAGQGAGGDARPAGRGLRAVRRTSEATDATPGGMPGEDPAAARASTRARVAERAEAWVREDDVLAEVRARCAEQGVVPVAPATAAALTFLAAATRARAVVEIGTGLGVGTLALLRGMPVDGLLTSIDTDGGRQAQARATALEAGFPPGRLRLITGSSRQVLPKLSDAGYDLVVVDGATTDAPRDLESARRLLRPGGVVAVDDVLWSGRIADPVRREALAGALRETLRAVREDEELVSLLLPISEGLLCAARR